MRLSWAPIARIGAVVATLGGFQIGLLPTFVWAQDDAAARAELEQRAQDQRNQEQPAPPVPNPPMRLIPEAPSSAAPPATLTPNMDIVPGGNVENPVAPESPPRSRRPGDSGENDARDPDAREQNRDGQNNSGPDNGGLNKNSPRDEIYRHPNLNYRDKTRPPKRRPDYRPPRPRPPTIVVRPYYYDPPPVIVRPYVPPRPPRPFYDDPPPPVWAGPLSEDVVWARFEESVYDALPWEAREQHERAFRLAISAPIGQPQSWNLGYVRGDITMIDALEFRNALCRDFVQTIRAPTWQRTVDGRVCLRPGQAWQLVAY